MGKGKSGKVQSVVLRAVCLSQDPDDNPKGGFLDGFTQHMQTPWKSNVEKPCLRLAHGTEKRENRSICIYQKHLIPQHSIPTLHPPGQLLRIMESRLYVQKRRWECRRKAEQEQVGSGQEPLKKFTRFCPKTSKLDTKAKVLSYSTPIGRPTKKWSSWPEDEQVSYKVYSTVPLIWTPQSIKF